MIVKTQTENHNQAQFKVAVLIGLFASITLSFLQYQWGLLYHDLGTVYPFFFENFHALNSYQTLALWMPDLNNGYPGYYFSMLGPVNIKTPIFMLFGLVAYLCGKMGIHLSNIFLFYQIYIGIVLPLSLVIASFLLARLMFRNRHVAYFITILAAFSPAVVLNLGDPGNLEPLAYDIFWTFAFLSYLRQPCWKNFAVLGLASGLVMLSLNYSFIAWGPIYFPLLLICCLIPLKRAKRVVKAIRVMPLQAWVALLLLCVVCATPTFVAMRDAKDFGSIRTDHLSYPYVELKTGNPLEALTASTPGITFTWNNYFPNPNGGETNQFLPYTSMVGDGAYTYLGLPVLALAVLGLLFGRPEIRQHLITFGVGTFMVGILSGYSPLFSTILFWQTPLRVYNHYSDILYRGGGCIILIFMAGLGLEVLLKRRNELGAILLRFYGISMLLSAALSFYLYHRLEDTLGKTFGLFLIVGVFTGIAVFHLIRASGKVAIRRASILLLIVLFLDVSTFSFGYVRSRIAVMKPEFKLNSGGALSVGMIQPHHPVLDWVATSLVQYRPLSEMNLAILESGRTSEILKGYDLGQINETVYSKLFMSTLDPLTVFRSVQFVAGAESEAFTSLWPRTFTGDVHERTLFVEVADEAAWQNSLKDAALMSLQTESKIQPTISKQTYLTLEFQGVSDTSGAVLIPMPWHKYWNATVNGKSVPLARVVDGLSAVPIPKGPYEVALKFDPTLIRFSLIGAYVALTIWCLIALGGFIFRIKRQTSTVLP